MPSRKSYAKHIDLTLDSLLVEHIDEITKRDFSTRSNLIRMAILAFLRQPANASKTKQLTADEKLALVLEVVRKQELELG
jgi:metal-responsive CopG/Arc/MetJ family transcriptional regulator